MEQLREQLSNETDELVRGFLENEEEEKDKDFDAKEYLLQHLEPKPTLGKSILVYRNGTAGIIIERMVCLPEGVTVEAVYDVCSEIQ